MREKIGSLVLLAFTRRWRRDSGGEMLSMLLDASEGSVLDFVRECAGLVAVGLRQRGAGFADRRRGRSIATASVIVIAAVVAALLTVGRSSSVIRRTSAIAAARLPQMRHGFVILTADILTRRFLPASPRSRLLELDETETRVRSADALSRLLAALSPGEKVLFVRPLTSGSLSWSSSLARDVRRRDAQFGAVFAGDRHLRMLTHSLSPEPGQGRDPYSDVLYVRS